MPPKSEERRDPFAGLGASEPVEDLGLTPRPAALDKRPRGRKSRIRPAEKRRRRRQVTVTFSSEDIPQRLRALARRWGLTAPDGKKPNVSAVVEHLILTRLKAAEAGELDPPEE